MQKKINFRSLIIFISIAFICFVLTLANSIFSNNIDEALVISGKINIPDFKSPTLEFSKNMLSLISYLQAFLLKLNFSNYTVNNLTLYFSTLFFYFGIFLVLKNLIPLILKKNVLIISFFSTFLFILSNTHLPGTDYPNTYFGYFSAGIYSISISTLIFGLVLEGKNKLAVFFLTILFLSHPVQGLWMISMYIILELINNILIKKKYEIKKIRFIFLSVIILIFFCLGILFLYSEINNPIINDSLIKVWLDNWEYHRNNITFNYKYLIITGVLFLISVICFVFFLKNKNEKVYKFFLLISLTTFFSTLVYILYKLTFNYLPLFLIVPMPTRVINTHAMIAYPVIIVSSIFLISFISNYLKVNKKLAIIGFSFAMLLFYTFNHQYNSLNDRVKNIYKNRFEKTYLRFIRNLNTRDKNLYDNSFINEIRKLDNNSYTIITHSTENISYRYGYKPYLIKISSFDYVLYRPTLLKQTIKILKEIYEVDFYKDKKFLSEKFIKIQFEKRSKNEWEKIKDSFNARYVIVPKNWDLNLKEILFNNKYSVYEIQ